MDTVNSSHVTHHADRVTDVSADEAFSLMKVQFNRLISLLDTLDAADWEKPTACTAWNVREIVAHQAGSYASGTGYREMLRQYGRIPRRGQLPEDGVNEFQLSERADRSAAELIAELREVGPIAIHKWAYQFRIAKLIAIPHPVIGLLSLRQLMWVIHSRDTWMHRLDICRATGRPFEQTADQDGRIAALVMRDVAKTIRGKLAEKSVLFDLSGIAGGSWKIGNGEPFSTIQMDVLDFNIFASGRFSYEEACARANLTGDRELAKMVLKNILILY